MADETSNVLYPQAWSLDQFNRLRPRPIARHKSIVRGQVLATRFDDGTVRRIDETIQKYINAGLDIDCRADFQRVAVENFLRYSDALFERDDPRLATIKEAAELDRLMLEHAEEKERCKVTAARLREVLQELESVGEDEAARSLVRQYIERADRVGGVWGRRYWAELLKQCGDLKSVVAITGIVNAESVRDRGAVGDGGGETQGGGRPLAPGAAAGAAPAEPEAVRAA